MSKNNRRGWQRNQGSNRKYRGLPQMRVINGERFKLGLFMVRSRNEDGSPQVLEHIRDDDTVDLRKPEETEFVTAYLSERGFKPEAPATEVKG